MEKATAKNVVCIIEIDNKYLSVSRTHNLTKVGFVGGGVEEGETLEQAILREILEEIGISTKARLMYLDTMDNCACFYYSEILSPYPEKIAMEMLFAVISNLKNPINKEGAKLSLVSKEFLCDKNNTYWPEYNKHMIELYEAAKHRHNYVIATTGTKLG